MRTARLLGASRMADMMLTGRSIDAKQAESWGLAQYVTPAGGAVEKAAELASHQQSDQRADFQLCDDTRPAPYSGYGRYDDGLFVESFIASFTSTSPEAEERLNAFLSKKAGSKVSRPDEK